MPNTASQKQIDFIKSLKEQRDITTEAAIAAGKISRELYRREMFTTQAASALIDVLKAQPKIQVGSLPDGEVFPPSGPGRQGYNAAGMPAPAPEGMHKVGPCIYKVQQSPNSGRRYAKQLREIADGDWSFEYAPGAMRLLSELTKMSLEDAKAFGVLYGTCCVCGRTLTNEESIAAGIGPICAGKF